MWKCESCGANNEEIYVRCMFCNAPNEEKILQIRENPQVNTNNYSGYWGAYVVFMVLVVVVLNVKSIFIIWVLNIFDPKFGPWGAFEILFMLNLVFAFLGMAITVESQKFSSPL